ncbi:MAG: FAD-dependent oxidoreductase [Pseudomonadota bacterium]
MLIDVKSMGIFFWHKKMFNQASQQLHEVTVAHKMEQLPIIIIGAGPIGMRLYTQLAQRYPQRSILIMGNENRVPYDRVQLSSILAGSARFEEISSSTDAINEGRYSRFVSAHIECIDREAKFVIDSQGVEYAYSKLVLATGSQPYVPAIKGIDGKGVYTFRSIRDAEYLAARRITSKHTVVLGGGLLGIEAARAMQRHNTQLTLVDHNSHLMFRQLDQKAGTRLATELRQQGLTVLTSSGITSVDMDSTPCVRAVRLRNGEQVECDTLIVATGIRPNIDLARASGLAFGRGIQVDSTMRTSDPDIFAIGECCEYDGQVYGLVAPGFEQADIAAEHLFHESNDHYRGSVLSTSLKVAGLAVFSLGDADPADIGVRSYVYEADTVYRRVNILHGRLVGIVAIGIWSELASLREYARIGKHIPPWKIWRFRQTGDIDSVGLAAQFQRLPDDATVCNCNAVSKAKIVALTKHSTCSVEQIGKLSNAGTGCGSCRPMLIAATSSSAPLAPQRGYKTLFAAASVSIVLAAIALFYPGAPYADTVQLAWHWDELWTSGLNKQISGFSLLAISVIGLLVSARKRLKWFANSHFSSWRIGHVVLGVMALLVLAAHTGFRFGSNLNLALMSTFTALVIMGGLMSIFIALEHKIEPRQVQLFRTGSLWAHVLLCWPIPALLGLHILKTYYF